MQAAQVLCAPLSLCFTQPLLHSAPASFSLCFIQPAMVKCVRHRQACGTARFRARGSSPFPAWAWHILLPTCITGLAIKGLAIKGVASMGMPSVTSCVHQACACTKYANFSLHGGGHHERSLLMTHVLCKGVRQTRRVRTMHGRAPSKACAPCKGVRQTSC